MNRIFSSATPESQGLLSKKINEFLFCLEEKKLPVHDFILMRNEKVLCEKYYFPFDADTLHRMFSVSKSLVSIAVGILQDKGKINLDDKISAYFPYLCQKNGLHPYMADLTLREMLVMASPHSLSTYKQNKNTEWIDSFFSVEPDHMSGMCFAYDTSSTHILTALIEKISGITFIDFLKKEFFTDLQIDESVYCLSDPQGVSMGGSGVMMAPYDLLKILFVLLNKGKYNDRQLISETFLRQALRVHFPLCEETASMGCEYMCGYGYQFWILKHNGFAMYGLGGQLGVCFPDKNLIFVLNADCQGRVNGLHSIFDSFFEKIYHTLSDKALEENVDTQNENTLMKKSGNLYFLQTVYEQKTVIKKTFTIDPNEMAITKIDFFTDISSGSLIYWQYDVPFCVHFGIGKNVFGQFPGIGFKCAACGSWLNEKTFLIKIQLIDSCMGNLLFECSFTKENAIVIHMKKNEDTFLQGFEGFLNGKSYL